MMIPRAPDVDGEEATLLKSREAKRNDRTVIFLLRRLIRKRAPRERERERERESYAIAYNL